GVPIKAWTDGVELETEAQEQLHNVAMMPFIHKHVAVMPDVHWGMGATIGSVIPTKGAIIPAAVGVDIGCGMQAVKTNWSIYDLPDNLSGVRSAIEAAVPHGRTNNGKQGKDQGGWRNDLPGFVKDAWVGDCNPNTLEEIEELHPQIRKANSVAHLGTLGTGNHFIEVCLDQDDNVWVMLHTGSRGIGNRIGSYFIGLAKEDMRTHFINLPDVNLAYLSEGTKYFDDYVKGVKWAQNFAKINRWLMMNNTLKAMEKATRTHCYGKESIIDCHHNYVRHEHHFGSNVYVTRKGAVRAEKGDLGIIPGSMGARSFIVRGKGNPQSFNSCSHGAGRRMSRRRAKDEFTLEDHAKATDGVECRKDASVLDETPGAYKNIDAVMAAQEDLVEVVHTLKQVVCVKG
ncbi:MAG: RtcB family protein, partial [Candidatus Hydrogenedentes bacterium]|nr:RtcB family protein [Candidatus Hydrogenedentota bacterium]